MRMSGSRAFVLLCCALGLIGWTLFGLEPCREEQHWFRLDLRTMEGQGRVDRDPEGLQGAPGISVYHYYGVAVSVQLTAVADAGWVFVEWRVGETGEEPQTRVENPTTVDFTAAAADWTAVAVFEPDEVTKYALTMAADPEVGGTATDETDAGPYTAGAVVDIKAEAAEGYQFVNWTAPAGEFGDAAAEETTFTMPAQDVTVTAHFTVVDLEEYTLTMAVNPAGAGTTTPAVGPHTYDGGTEVAITATPATGWEFSHWTVSDGVDVDNPDSATTTVVVDEDKTVTAHFTEEEVDPEEYALTMAVEGEGTTTPAVGPHTYDEGTEVAITATPATGWEFSHWTVSDGADVEDSDSATTTVVVDEDKTVTAHFTEEEVDPEEYTLTMAVNPAGAGTATDETDAGPYTAGTVVSIKAEAAEGYQFVNWTAPAGEFGDAAAEETTFTMPAQHVTVTANFAFVEDPTITADKWFESGWQLLSVPVVPEDTSPGSVFWSVLVEQGALIIREWVPGASYYEPTEINPGRGYWVWLQRGQYIEVTGAAQFGAYEVELANAGWHLVSTPVHDVRWGDIEVVVGDAEPIPLYDAIHAGVIMPYIYWHKGVEGDPYSAVRIDQALDLPMRPWTGYWLKSFEPDVVFILHVGAQPYVPDVPMGVLSEGSLAAIPLELRPPQLPKLPLSADMLDALAYPNPASSNPTVTFAVRGHLAPAVTALRVRVHDIAGLLVYEDESTVRSLAWDMMGPSGRRVASGVYVYTLEVELNGTWVRLRLGRLLILR